ncbi:MAG TPA: Gfo/Idh/MocA family oxidoreductase [Bacteroidales bacterium]|nr:Gfo/Idh/MocA family oxidoreductase [Bacteroidales bacterium]
MPVRTFNISIAGCSRVAHLHAKAIKNIPGARLAGVWNRTRSKADEFAKVYNTVSYPDVKSMVKETGSDLVIVCNWHPHHLQPVIEAAKAGANVLVEKPLAADLKDCDEMIRICSGNNVKLGVISQRRWLDPVIRIKNAIDNGKLGRPVLATVTMLGWRDKDYYDSDPWRGSWKGEGGGVLVNQSPHQLDIMLWLMGDIDEVYGLWRNLNHPYIEVEDTALAIIKFKSGAIGNIIVSNSQKPGLFTKVHIHGDNGASAGVQTDGGAMFIAGKTGMAEPPYNDIWTVPGEASMLKQWVKEDADKFNSCDPTVAYIQYQIEDYLSAIRENREPLSNGESGRKTVELFTAIYRSGRDNKPVKFPLKPEPGLDGRNF